MNLPILTYALVPILTQNMFPNSDTYEVEITARRSMKKWVSEGVQNGGRITISHTGATQHWKMSKKDFGNLWTIHAEIADKHFYVTCDHGSDDVIITDVAGRGRYFFGILAPDGLLYLKLFGSKNRYLREVNGKVSLHSLSKGEELGEEFKWDFLIGEEETNRRSLQEFLSVQIHQVGTSNTWGTQDTSINQCILVKTYQSRQLWNLSISYLDGKWVWIFSSVAENGERLYVSVDEYDDVLKLASTSSGGLEAIAYGDGVKLSPVGENGAFLSTNSRDELSIVTEDRDAVIWEVMV